MKNHLFSIVATSNFVLVDAFFAASAIIITPQKEMSSSSSALDFIGTYDAKGRHLTFNPQDDFNVIDHDRAKECIEKFGECSIQELEQIKSRKLFFCSMIDFLRQKKTTHSITTNWTFFY
jgi:hypothetical protein